MPTVLMPIQLTRTGSGHTANPRWSLNDRAILFNSWTPRSNLYTVHVNNGSVKQITSDPVGNRRAEVGPEMERRVLFRQHRPGRWRSTACPATGGSASQITRNGGCMRKNLPTRKWLYYSKNAESPSSIWRVPRDGGQETLVIDGLSYSTNFMPAENGIYFISSERGVHGPSAIEFDDFSTSRRMVVTALDKPVTLGLALSPDRRWLIHGLVDHISKNLMLVENFR